MRFGPVRPARIDFSDPQAPTSPDFGDVYHSRAGALLQAHHVFLQGNGLPGRWAGRPRFVVLETGFGLGHNFLATWAAWRQDAQRCTRLWFVSIEKHPPTLADLARVHADSPLSALAGELQAQWPPSTPDLHAIDFERGRVRLLLVQADIAAALPELVAQADAIYLDGFAPARNPAMWDARLLRGLNRLAAPDATVATWSVARDVREALTTAGFAIERVPGIGGKREITVGRFAPRHVAPPPPGRRAHAAVAGSVARSAVIVGGGLAGAAAAQALAAQGVATLVLDRHAEPAQETSGNAGGLFHGIVHRDDGPHARWLRAAALLAHRRYAPLVAAGAVPGRTDGLLRGEQSMSIEAMREVVASQALPAAWVEAWTAEQARAWTGLPWSGPAWHYPTGGWVSPPALVRESLQHDGVQWRGGTLVQALRRHGDRWHLLGGDGQVLADADVVVLANAADAARLLGTAPGPWQRVRGQVSLWAGAPHPLPHPVADSGYALTLADGRLLFGATSQPDDEDPAVRDSDHAHNLGVLRRLTGPSVDACDAAALGGRVGWRMQTADRLPWIGPAPSFDGAAPPRRDQPRLVPRRSGLYLLAGLGSRGLTHAPLAGELLAAWITGAPLPLPASLVDAVDPARFAARAARRSAEPPDA
ncbi:FAD-dependent 5-carboxymethylaminomethyl-2-thiouridine(34) oxidoreductase MnmC [Ideonella sp. A 288]|uniref:FAD-dependent 5-carboxymethylaminomethyl-2-thiouridine(34) oxidoreductase MnmC n=1 Tax=Ideonella sp. A 288 TaxID=1962181 RepID=UPI000B4A8AFA|nr:FAD-dependent 5-carboxymethylaminomethyl-2-thiouridine(34) oxidoreductase MnmC [Ideonella sp. A 288]